MTKSTITREQLEEWVTQFDEDGGCDSTDRQLEALIRQSLAAMDSSESVELPLDYLQGHKDGLEWAAQLAKANHPETGDWLYDDPIELAKAIRKGPDMPPVQPVEDSEPVAYISKSDFDAGYPHILARRDFNKACTMAVYAAQPAPVVPELRVDWQENEFSAGWNACRAAMLQELKKSAGTEATCRSNENAQVLTSINPAPDLVSLQKKAESIIGNYPVIPDGSASMLRRWLAFGRGMQNAGSQLPHNLIAETESMLAAAPQSPGSEPATVPGKWIPVSERMPDDDDFVYIWPRPDFGVELHVGQYCECSPKGDGWYAQVYEQNYGIEWHPITVTHWMPLPAAPQEVNHG